MSSAEEAAAAAYEAGAKAFVNQFHDINLGTFVMAMATDSVMFGLMIVQTIDYWRWSGEDKRMNKIIVATATVSASAVSIFMVVCMFHLFVYGFGVYGNFTTTTLLPWMCLVDIIPSTATQFFFAHRAYRMSKNNKILGAAMGLLIMLSVAGGIGMIPAYQTLDSASQVSADKVRAMMYLWLSGGLGADVLITVVILASLLRSRTGWKATDRAIKKLLTILIETQIPPTIVILVFFITYGRYSETFLDVWPQWVQSKFYVCGLLASLNSRYSLRRALDNEIGQGTQRPTVVHVLTETYVQRSEGTEVPPLPAGVKSKPSYPKFTSHSNNSGPKPYPSAPSFTPRRLGRKELEVDIDDESLEEHKASGTTVVGDGDDAGYEGHKMDYIDNPSRTGLTDADSVDGGAKKERNERDMV
ncbi:hypothetical protein IAT38_006856 [Cryptococcus sp. DSM 104549]